MDSVNAGNGVLLQDKDAEIAQLRLLLAAQQQLTAEASVTKDKNWMEEAKQIKASQANASKALKQIRRVVEAKQVSEEDKADKKQQARELEKGVCAIGGGSIKRKPSAGKTPKQASSKKKAKTDQTKERPEKGKDAAKKQAANSTDKQPLSEGTDKQATTDVDATKKASAIVVSCKCSVLSTVARMSSDHVPIIRGGIWPLITNMRQWKFVITGGIREVNLRSRFTTNPRAKIMRIMRSGRLLLLPC